MRGNEKIGCKRVPDRLQPLGELQVSFGTLVLVFRFRENSATPFFGLFRQATGNHGDYRM